MDFLAFILTVLYVVTSLLSPEVFPDDIRELHVNLILGVLAILVCIPSFGKSRMGRLLDTRFFLGLLVASTIAVLLTGWFGGALNNLLIFIPIIITFPFIVISCGNLSRLKIITWALLGTAFYIFAHGILAAMANDVHSPYLEKEGVISTGVEFFRYRGLGVLADPNDTAQFYVTLIPLLWLRWKKKSPFSNTLFTLLPAIVLLVAIYFTHSRGALLAVTAMVWYGFRKKLGFTASTIFSVVALAAMIGLGMSGGRAIDDDDGGRVAAWSTGLEVFRAHPLFGVGMDNFPDYNDTGMTAHNSYVLCLAELGITGYFCWMGMIVVSWSGLTRIVKMKEGLATAEDEVTGLAGASTPNPWLPAKAAAPQYGELALAGAYQHSSVAVSADPEPVASVNPMDFGSPYESEQRPTTEELARIAYVMQTAMVGLLVTCYFLSRSYSMVLYVTLGMVAALRVIEGRNENVFSFTTRETLKKVSWAVFASILFLYLFVRFHGV
jgi:putative inorganic carbon (HCO3(-)) transporter